MIEPFKLYMHTNQPTKENYYLEIMTTIEDLHSLNYDKQDILKCFNFALDKALDTNGTIYQEVIHDLTQDELEALCGTLDDMTDFMIEYYQVVGYTPIEEMLDIIEFEMYNEEEGDDE
ncbi:MAG: hypothetical protein ACRCST_03080 [Turicibacter sp.]